MEPASNPYVVPKRAVPIEIIDADGSERRLAVFVAPIVTGHDGSERVSDLLQGKDDFIPAVDRDTNQPVWLGRPSLLLVCVDDALERGGAEEHTVPTEHEIEVTLSTGLILRGLVSYVRPEERSRLTDFLNDRAPFLRLLQVDRVVLVNKRHIARITLGSP